MSPVDVGLPGDPGSGSALGAASSVAAAMLSGLPQGLFLDAFFTLSHSTEDGPLSNSQNVLKALRWYKKLLALSCLPDLYGPAFSLLSSPATQEKRESVPLPLAFLVFLEKLLLSGSWGNAYGPAPSWCLWARAFAFQTANISSGARFALAVSHFTLRCPLWFA